MGTGRPEDQPLPVENGLPFVQALMQADLDLELSRYGIDPDIVRIIGRLKESVELRRRLGEKRYGVAGLQPFNGRDMLRDAFEEVVDACVYVKALACEREGDFDDTYSALMVEAMALQAAIMDREEADAAATAQAESETSTV